MSKKAKILWTTDNKETALHMVCLYAHNALLKGWMDEVEVLVWGASQRLIVEDAEVRAKVEAMIRDGVKVVACLKCADSLEITAPLQTCGIDVHYTGELLSTWINSGESVISV
jgi:hypothetical protein